MFGDIADGMIEAEISGRLCPEYEGFEYTDMDTTLKARLRVSHERYG